MGGSFLGDKAALLFSTVYAVAVVAGRWSSYWASGTTALTVLLQIPLFLSIFAVSHFAESWYHRHRTALLLGGKAVALLLRSQGELLVHKQFRLNGTPTGSALSDSLAALQG
jgi:hypothetical protein